MNPLHQRSPGGMQRFAGVSIDHRRDLELVSIDGCIELEVNGPHHVLSVRVDDRVGTRSQISAAFDAGA